VDVTVNYDVSLEDDVSGAVAGDAASDIDIKLYFVNGSPATLVALNQALPTAIATLNQASAVGDGAHALETTIAWADLDAAFSNAGVMSAKLYAVIDSFTDAAGAGTITVVGDNDMGSATLTTQAADLQISVSLDDPSSIAVGDSVKVRYTASNDGDVLADNATINFYWAQDDGTPGRVLLNTETFDLWGGSSRNGSFNVDYDDLIDAIGSATDGGLIVAEIDEADTIEEVAFEANNTNTTAQLEFDNIESLPDLTVYGLRISDTDIAYDEDLTLRVKYGNDGDTGYSDATGVLLTVHRANDDEVIHTEVIGAVGLGDFDYNYAFDVAYGDIQYLNGVGVYVTIDGDEDDFSAINDTTSTIVLTVDDTENLPDLEITSSTADVDVLADWFGDYNNVAVGTDLVWDITVANTGDLSASKVVTSFYWFDDGAGGGSINGAYDGETLNLLGTDDNHTLNVSESDTDEGITFDYDDVKAHSGKYFIAQVDADDDIRENDELNNLSDTFKVTWEDEVADLKINDISVRGYDDVGGKKTLSRGDDLHIKLKVENEGTADFAAATTTYYLSSDTTIDVDDVALGTDNHGMLEAGEVDNYEPFTVDWDTLDGRLAENGTSSYLIAKINKEGTGEVDVADNTSTAVKIALEAETNIDFSFSFRAGDNVVAPDAPVYIDATLQNNGEQDARKVTTEYYFTDVAANDDAIHDASNTLLGEDNNGWLNGGELDNDEGIRVKFNAFDTSGGIDFTGFVYGVVYIDGVEHTRTDAAGVDLTVDVPSAADLTYSDFSIDGGNTLAIGEKITVDMTVANGGETKSDAVKTKIFWSSDNTYNDGVDVLIDSESHGSLLAGSSKTESETFRFADLAANGDGYLIAALFDSDDVHTGAVSAIDFSFAGGVTVAEAEFSVDAVTPDVTADTLDKGDKLRVDYTVSNNGLLAGTGATTFYWSTDGTLDDSDAELGSDSNYRLSAGEVDDNEVFKISYDNLLDALDAASFDVDPGDADLTGSLIAKINDTTDPANTAVLAVGLNIELYDGAELTIEDGSLNKTSIDDDDKLVFNFDVDNSGDVDVKARTKFYWSDDASYDDGSDTYLELDGHGTVHADGSKGQSESFSYSQLLTANGGTGTGYIIARVEEVDTGVVHDTVATDQITLEVLV
jgi:hypothetical protein